MSQSIGDFFVKIGLKVDNQQSLNGLTTRLNNAATAAELLVKNLNKIPAALNKLNIPVNVTKSGSGSENSGNKKAGPYKNPIGPKADWTQYNEKLGPSSAYYAVDLKKRDEAEKAHLLLKTKSDKQQTVKQKADELQLKTGNKLFSQVAKGKVSVSDLAGAFVEVSAATATVGAIFVGAVIGLAKISQYATKAGESLFQFHLTTGVSIKSLQEWQLAASQFGAKGEDVADAIGNIQKAQTDIQLGQGNMAPWALLGINPNQDPLDVLTQIHEKIKEGSGISAAMGRKLTAQLGINDATFQMLRRADLSVKQLKESMALSSKETEAFDKVNQAMGVMEFKFGAVAQKIGTMLAPAALGFAELLDDIADISLKVIDLLNDFDKSSFGQWLSKIGDQIDKFIDPFRIFHDLMRDVKAGTAFNNPFASASGGADLNKNLPSGSSSTSSNTNNNTISVQINGAGDPNAVIKEMHKEISKGLFNSYGSVSDLSMIGSTAF